MTRMIIAATRNPGKQREIARVLDQCNVRIAGLDGFDDLPEPEETGETFGENARDKARYYARATGQWCLADDSGLAVDALGGCPGVYSARYGVDRCRPDASRGEIDQANNDKLLAELADVPDEKRTARFLCHLALANPKGEILLEATGTFEGKISQSPEGENGFGYDPLFYVPEKGCSSAELDPDAKNAISHRGLALRDLATQLPTLLP